MACSRSCTCAVQHQPHNHFSFCYLQVDTAGDSLSCCAMSPSGEALVFGGSGGYTHLWSSSSTPRIVAHNRTVVHLKHPTTQVNEWGQFPFQ